MISIAASYISRCTFSFVNKKKLRWNCSVEANHMKCNTLLQGWKFECYLLSTSKAGNASKSSNFHIFPVNGSGNCNEGEKKVMTKGIMVLYLLQMKVTRQGTQHLSELHHLLSVESTLLQSNCLRTSDVAIKLMIDPDQTMKITISKVFRPHTGARLQNCHFVAIFKEMSSIWHEEASLKRRRRLLIAIDVKW